MNPDELSQKRCFNHARREAAARCPNCRRFFCRECVTEHGGRVICADCLHEMTRKGGTTRLIAMEAVRYVTGLLGLATGWACFYYLGRILLLLPSSFHEGTIWGE